MSDTKAPLDEARLDGLARTAYEAWSTAWGWGEMCTGDWPVMTAASRAAWQEVARAVVGAYVASATPPSRSVARRVEVQKAAVQPGPGVVTIDVIAEFFDSEGCVLCANVGTVVRNGEEYPCICPNGRQIATALAAQEPPP